MPHPTNSLENRQRDLRSALVGLTPPKRLALGLTLSTLIAYYVPQLLLACFGLQVIINVDVQLAFMGSIYVTLNLIGHRWNCVFAANLIAAAVYDVFFVAIILRATPLNGLWHFWAFFFVPTLGAMLNAALFQYYRHLAYLTPSTARAGR